MNGKNRILIITSLIVTIILVVLVGSSESEMIKVESSCFDEIGYEKLSEKLYVRFVHGGLYVYDSVSEDEFESFLDAESKGTYYNRHIKGRYPCERIQEKVENEMENCNIL